MVQHEGDKPWDDPHGSPFWKDMSHIAPAFRCSVAHQIGSGSNTSFWHDNWLGTVLKYSFPILYQTVYLKYCSVQHCITQSGWHIPGLAASPAAQDEKDRLLTQLQHVHPSHGPDKVIWLRSSNSVFSVSSTYKFLAQTPSPVSLSHNLWQLKAPLRVLVFAWLLLNNRLTTVDNLVRRGWHLPNMCAMCRMDEETTLHLFQTCPLAVQIRTYIHSVFGSQFSIPNRYTAAASTTMLTDPSEQKTARCWELTTCFVLWRERCRRIFSEQTQSSISLVREIRLEYSSWFGQTART